MERSKTGWRFTDLEKVYIGLGFKVREGGKHRLYIHPVFPELRATVARSRTLAIGYVEHALSLARRLKQMEADRDEKS